MTSPSEPITITKGGRSLFGPASAEYKAAKSVSVFELAGTDSGTCPLCESGTFAVDPEANRWTCSECGGDETHGPIGFVMRRDNVDSHEAVHWLAGRQENPAQLFEYLKHDLPVFPLHDMAGGKCSCGKHCASPGKHPRTADGFKSASSDPDQIREWLKKWPGCNWGMATGQQSGIIVIDIDGKSDGFESWDALRNEHPEPIETPIVTTGGDQRGEHWYFGYPESGLIKSSSGKLGRGLDIRSDGGYVVIPPSATVYSYEFDLSFQDAELAFLPAWLREKLIAIPEERERVGERIGQLEVIREGERHQTLVAVAGSMRQSGLVEEEIRAGLEALAKSRFSKGSHPVARDEIREVVEWVAEKPRSFHCTDLGNAERLIDQYGDSLLYCHPWRMWLSWDGQRWKLDDTAQVKRWAHRTVRSIYTEANNEIDEEQRKKLGKWATACEARNRIDSMIAQADALVPILPDQFDIDPMLLNVRNGVLDLKSGELLLHDPKLLITKMFNAEYQREAECPRWESFIDLVTGGDAEMAQFLRFAMGYSLTGRTDEHAFFNLYGPGANGKTTFTEAALRLWGDYGKRTHVESLMMQFRQASGPRPEIVALKGVRLAVGSEIPEGRKLNAALVKDLTGGDSITARDLYKSGEVFRPSHKLWIFGNYRPVITDMSLGMWRRVRLVPFNVTIPTGERRPMDDVLAEFEEESSGILNWLLDGCLLWQSNRLMSPKSVADATNEYRREEDVLQQFLDERCEMHPDFLVNKDDLFKAMNGWADETNEMDLLRRSKRWLTGQLQARGIERDAGKRNYVGIRCA